MKCFFPKAKLRDLRRVGRRKWEGEEVETPPSVAEAMEVEKTQRSPRDRREDALGWIWWRDVSSRCFVGHRED